MIRLAVVALVCGLVVVGSGLTAMAIPPCGLTPGSGLDTGKYLVSSKADLDSMRVGEVNEACTSEALVLTGDIDLTIAPWSPITGFIGSFDGRGHTISNLVLTGSRAGLFEVGGAGASFSDLNISTSLGSATTYVGALVGFSMGPLVIDNVHVTGNVSGSGASVGGLVGEAGSTVDVTGSSVSGNVTAGDNGLGSSYAGGVVGYAPMGAVTLTTVSVVGDVSGSGARVGGLVGEAGSTVDVTNSLYSGMVNGTYKVGGLVGMALDAVVMENVYVAGSRPDPAVTDQGGFLGSVSGTLTVTASFCTGADCGVGNRVDDADLKMRSTFTGWDFDTVWCLSSSVNNGYPVLRAITNPVVGFAPCWAPVVVTPTPYVTPIWRVNLDPNGGACADGDRRHDDEWTSVFVGYRYLPGAVECERDSFEFSGWADVELPDEVVDLPILVDPTDGLRRAFIAANADLIAVWKEVEVELDDLTGTAPGAFVGGPDRRTREGGGVVEGYYIPPNTLFGAWMLASA